MAWAAITKHNRPAGLNDSYLFLIVMEAGKSKMMMLADTVPREKLRVCSQGREREREL